MTNLNGFSLAFSGVEIKDVVSFLLESKIKSEQIHICTEHSIMFFSTKTFNVLCELIEERFSEPVLIQFSQIKPSPSKKFLVKCSPVNKETAERFNELKK